MTAAKPHVCENPPCTNWIRLAKPLCCGPDCAKARQRRTRTEGRLVRSHCHRGHPYDTDNTHVTAKGFRVCRTCARARQRASQHKQYGWHREWRRRRAEQVAALDRIKDEFVLVPKNIWEAAHEQSA